MFIEIVSKPLFVKVTFLNQKKYTSIIPVPVSETAATNLPLKTTTRWGGSDRRQHRSDTSGRGGAGRWRLFFHPLSAALGFLERHFHVW